MGLFWRKRIAIVLFFTCFGLYGVSHAADQALTLSGLLEVISSAADELLSGAIDLSSLSLSDLNKVRDSWEQWRLTAADIKQESFQRSDIFNNFDWVLPEQIKKVSALDGEMEALARNNLVLEDSSRKAYETGDRTTFQKIDSEIANNVKEIIKKRVEQEKLLITIFGEKTVDPSKGSTVFSLKNGGLSSSPFINETIVAQQIAIRNDLIKILDVRSPLDICVLPRSDAQNKLKEYASTLNDAIGRIDEELKNIAVTSQEIIARQDKMRPLLTLLLEDANTKKAAFDAGKITLDEFLQASRAYSNASIIQSVLKDAREIIGFRVSYLITQRAVFAAVAKELPIIFDTTKTLRNSFQCNPFFNRIFSSNLLANQMGVGKKIYLAPPVSPPVVITPISFAVTAQSTSNSNNTPRLLSDSVTKDAKPMPSSVGVSASSIPQRDRPQMESLGMRDSRTGGFRNPINREEFNRATEELDRKNKATIKISTQTPKINMARLIPLGNNIINGIAAVARLPAIIRRFNDDFITGITNRTIKDVADEIKNLQDQIARINAQIIDLEAQADALTPPQPRSRGVSVKANKDEAALRVLNNQINALYAVRTELQGMIDWLNFKLDEKITRARNTGDMAYPPDSDYWGT